MSKATDNLVAIVTEKLLELPKFSAATANSLYKKLESEYKGAELHPDELSLVIKSQAEPAVHERLKNSAALLDVSHQQLLRKLSLNLKFNPVQDLHQDLSKRITDYSN